VNLTSPISVNEIRSAYPRDTRGMEEAEIATYLEDLEFALRRTYGVVRTDHEADGALRFAMRRAWPSFLQQVHQIASVDASTNGHSVTYNRPGIVDLAFPKFIGDMLASVSDADLIQRIPSTTELVR